MIDDDGRIYVVRRFRARPPSLEALSIQSFADSTMTLRIEVDHLAPRSTMPDRDGAAAGTRGEHLPIR